MTKLKTMQAKVIKWQKTGKTIKRHSLHSCSMLEVTLNKTNFKFTKCLKRDSYRKNSLGGKKTLARFHKKLAKFL